MLWGGCEMYINILHSAKEDKNRVYETWHPITMKWILSHVAETGLEIEDWINENSRGFWTISSYASYEGDSMIMIFFQFEDDAVLFKLRWL